MATVIEKENAILAGQVAQGQILSQIATAIAGISTGDNTALLEAISRLDTHVGNVEALIGSEPAPAPDSAPTV